MDMEARGPPFKQERSGKKMDAKGSSMRFWKGEFYGIFFSSNRYFEGTGNRPGGRTGGMGSDQSA